MKPLAVLLTLLSTSSSLLQPMPPSWSSSSSSSSSSHSPSSTSGTSDASCTGTVESLPYSTVPTYEHYTQTLENMGKRLDDFKNIVRDLSRQTMLVQFAMEERVRSDGDSGIKLLRGASRGPDNFYENGLVGNQFNSIHDHSNYDRTIGMGEVIAVMNGVEFRTRHNDFKLVMPSTNSTDYHATEPIPFPEVPEEVRSQPSVDAQILEMREWFKAFTTQNTTHRDYRKYFKPVLCYMEGAWTLANENLDEPFQSDRHQLAASSWFDLQEKVRFTSFSGAKDRKENLAYLPTTIISVNETTGLPMYAQWNYRILCSPLKEDVPLSELRVVDDMAYRVPRKRSNEGIRFTRGARFRLYEYDKDQFTKYSKLDRLFYNIPGKDNIPGNLTSTLFGDSMFDQGAESLTPLKTGYYHRMYKFDKLGAMGIKSVSRGFNDAHMWVAQTTQERVAPIGLKQCELKEFWVNGKLKKRQECKMVYSRYSYAIPLEIIYLTPLHTWNPYNIVTGKERKEIFAGGRGGGVSKEKAFNGTDYSHHYITPVEFFEGRADASDPADTVRKAVGVLDRDGNLRRTTASGVKIMLQAIEGVGKVRLRYPISPAHDEGSSVWKELNAFKELAKEKTSQDTGPPANIAFLMSTTFREPPGTHDHEFLIPFEKVKGMLTNGDEVEVVTSESHDHTHKLVVFYSIGRQRFEYKWCGGKRFCVDGHPRVVTVTSDISAYRDELGPAGLIY